MSPMGNDPEIPIEGSPIVGSVYLHIGNGGVMFTVTNSWQGPKLLISSRHYGNNSHTQEIMMDKAGIDALSDLFAKAKETEFSDAHVCAAQYMNTNAMMDGLNRGTLD